MAYLSKDGLKNICNMAYLSKDGLKHIRPKPPYGLRLLLWNVTYMRLRIYITTFP